MTTAEAPQDKTAAPAKKARGGARKGGGVKAADGAQTTRVQLTLDAATLATFKRLGLGNASLGAREAARLLGEPTPRRDVAVSTHTPPTAV